MNLDEMIRLIQAVSDSSLSKIDIEEGSFKLSMMTDKMPAPVLQGVVSSGFCSGVSGAGSVTAEQGTAAPAQPAMAGVQAAQSMTAADLKETKAPTDFVSASETGVGEMASDLIVKSPLVGTFYNASSPESDPFVKVGDTVKKGQTLAIIEAMKLMNEIESEYDGVVEAILADNEQVVEYGQPLFRIR